MLLHRSIRRIISIHDLTRRSTLLKSMLSIGIFQFTTSQGGRLFILPCISVCILFQFTTSQGGRRYLQAYFQSVILSIHDLTRRSTDFDRRCLDSVRISIHDLTRRSTVPLPDSLRLEVFQFTTSQGGRPSTALLSQMLGSFNSRPHKEVD